MEKYLPHPNSEVRRFCETKCVQRSPECPISLAILRENYEIDPDTNLPAGVTGDIISSIDIPDVILCASRVMQGYPKLELSANSPVDIN